MSRDDSLVLANYDFLPNDREKSYLKWISAKSKLFINNEFVLWIVLPPIATTKSHSTTRSVVIRLPISCFLHDLIQLHKDEKVVF